MHLALTLPDAVPDREVVAIARANGLEPRALSTHHVGRGRAPNGLVLGYANVGVDVVDGLVRQLANAVEQVSRRRRV